MTGAGPRGWLSGIAYDLKNGGGRRIIEPTIARWAASHPPDADVLEVGAGHFDHSRHFTVNYTKFDADPDQHPDVVGDAHAMPFDDGRFDSVLAVAVLEHVDDPYQVTREIHRVLRPGGRVFAAIPFFEEVHGYPEDISRFTAYGARRLFELAGFEVTRVDERPYAGAFFQASNVVHLLFPRRSRRRWVRLLNTLLFLVARAGYPLDRRFDLRLRTLYLGSELEARKPLGGEA